MIHSDSIGGSQLSDLANLIERKILEVVRESGKKGILQREIWKILGLDSRNGARIIRRLEQQGFVTRDTVTYKGRKTYMVFATKKALTPLKIPDEVKEIPCFSCEKLERCGEGAGINPITCKKLNNWLKEKIRGNGR